MLVGNTGSNPGGRVHRDRGAINSDRDPEGYGGIACSLPLTASCPNGRASAGKVGNRQFKPDRSLWQRLASINGAGQTWVGSRRRVGSPPAQLDPGNGDRPACGQSLARSSIVYRCERWRLTPEVGARHPVLLL